MNDFKSVQVVKEKSVSGDFSQVVAAASKSSQQISNIEFEQKEKSFELRIEHIGIIVGIASLISFVLSCLAFEITPSQIFLNGSEYLSAVRGVASYTTGTAVITFIFLLAFASRNMNATTRYSVEYSSNEQVGAGASVQKHTFRVEVKEKNHMMLRDLPEWFTQHQLFAILEAGQEDENFVFNRSNLSKNGIVPASNFSELKQNFEHCQFIKKDGKSYTLTDEFFAFAEKAKAEI